MVFIHRIVEAGPRHVVCLVIPGARDAELTHDGVVPAAMGVEYMAQAIGVYAGLQAAPDQRRNIGYVIAVRNLSIAVPAFTVDDPLAVRALRQWGEERVGRFEAWIERERDGQRLAHAFMSVYRPTAEELV
jgi:predicted hotdog family 3-hydroxylacyl-ACP dehydratase